MKIGLIAVGLNTYWHQFGGLRERLDGYRNAIKEKMEAYGGQIVADAGMVDDVDKAHAAAALFRRDEAEVLFIFISTYALSSTLIPFLGEGIPVVLLNLQPAPAIDYARLNGMSDRGEMTGEWLANCQACSLPEFCSVFNRAGTKYDVVTGYLDDAQASTGGSTRRRSPAACAATAWDCWATTTAAWSTSTPTSGCRAPSSAPMPKSWRCANCTNSAAR